MTLLKTVNKTDMYCQIYLCYKLTLYKYCRSVAVTTVKSFTVMPGANPIKIMSVRPGAYPIVEHLKGISLG
jgi:hypothetical protein